MSLLTVLCHTQVITWCCVDFINQSLEIICWWMSRGMYVTKSQKDLLRHTYFSS